MCGVLHILKTPEDSSCVSEGNQPPRARQRKSSKQHTQREARVPPNFIAIVWSKLRTILMYEI